MKKIISFIATVAMVSSLFVSVVKADFLPTVTSTVGDKITNADFNDYMGEDIPEGYDVYPVTVTFSNLGDLTNSIKAKKHTGRKIQGFGYEMTFDDIDSVDTDYTMLYDNVFGTMSEGFDESKYSAIFNAGSADVAYPTTATTISNETGIEDGVTVWVVVESGKTVTATLNTYMTVITYSSSTPGEEEVVNNATMSPASLVFGGAPSTVDVASVELDKSALELKVGGTYDLAETVKPDDATDKSVTYSSSNTSVATVDAATGVVTAVAKGTATITVTTTDGGKTATCAVKVLPVDVVPAAADKKVVSNATADLVDVNGTPVTIDPSRSYGAAKFDSVQIEDSNYIYKVVATDADGNEKAFDIADGDLEVSGTASFIAIVWSATRTITDVVLKAFAK